MLDTQSYVSAVREASPLVHCITNYVTVHDVANVLIAAGAAPIMSDDETDAPQITAICNALVINIGTLNASTIKGMFAAGQRARELEHVRILDPVGAGASKLRTDTAVKLLDEIGFQVVRGNISEIKALAIGQYDTKGVDASAADTVTDENLADVLSFVKEYAKSLGSVVVATGAIDLVTDGNRSFAIREGSPMMSDITGSGCMLSALIGAFVAASPGSPLEATAAALAYYGRAGARAAKLAVEHGRGNATFSNYLIDEVYLMDSDILSEKVLIDEV